MEWDVPASGFIGAMHVLEGCMSQTLTGKWDIGSFFCFCFF